MIKHPNSINLYNFIRSILGDKKKISDREISRRWGMNIKTFMEIKHGRLPVPKIDRLDELINLLKFWGYDYKNYDFRHEIWDVCMGRVKVK